MLKKCSINLVWGHPFSTYVSYDRFFNPHPLYELLHNLDDPPSNSPVVYVLNGWHIYQPKNIYRISYSLKYKYLEKKFFMKKWIDRYPWKITKRFSVQNFDGWKFYLNLFKTFLILEPPGNLLESRDISQIRNGTIFWSTKIQAFQNLIFYTWK